MRLSSACPSPDHVLVSLLLEDGFTSEVPTFMSCSAVGKGRSGRACKLEDG